MNYTELPFYWINRLSFVSRKMLSQRFKEAGHAIAPEEWAVLLVLWSRGPQAPSTLSDETVRDRTTVTRRIDGLVRQGLVVRTESKTDRRRFDVSLTPAGEALRDQLVPIAMGVVSQAIDGVSPKDLDTTLRTLRAFSENLNPEAPGE